jgi:hypothetical protein
MVGVLSSPRSPWKRWCRVAMRCGGAVRMRYFRSGMEKEKLPPAPRGSRPAAGGPVSRIRGGDKPETLCADVHWTLDARPTNDTHTWSALSMPTTATATTTACIRGAMGPWWVQECRMRAYREPAGPPARPPSLADSHHPCMRARLEADVRAHPLARSRACRRHE